MIGHEERSGATKFYAFGIRLPCWLWRLIYGPVRMSDRPASYPHEWWRLAGPVEAGTASSAVTLTFGCGHVVNAVSGDALYHTCPFCFIDREAAK